MVHHGVGGVVQRASATGRKCDVQKLVLYCLRATQSSLTLVHLTTSKHTLHMFYGSILAESNITCQLQVAL